MFAFEGMALKRETGLFTKPSIFTARKTVTVQRFPALAGSSTRFRGSGFKGSGLIFTPLNVFVI